MVAKAYRWKKAEWVNQLVLCLKDGAFTAFKQIPTTDQDNYDKVKDHLMNALEPVEKSKFYSSLLYNPSSQRVQQPNEPVSFYASDIEKIVLGAHPISNNPNDSPEITAARHEERNTIMLNAFIGGLLDKFKDKVLDAEPTKFEKALEVAKKAEARSLLRRNIQLDSLSANDSFQTLSAHSYASQNNYYYDDEDSTYTSLFCRYCKEEGDHEIQDCPILKRKNARQKRSQNECHNEIYSAHIQEPFDLQSSLSQLSEMCQSMQTTMDKRLAAQDKVLSQLASQITPLGNHIATTIFDPSTGCFNYSTQ